MSQATATVTVEPVTPAIGAYVRGLDLRGALDDTSFAALHQALLDHLVVFLPAQRITPAEQWRFCERFGPVMLPLFDTASTEQPGVTVMDQIAPRGILTDRWHTDHAFLEEPPMGTVLRAVQLPSVGGDTCFANMYAAYDALSSRMQRLLDGTTALNGTDAIASSTSVKGVFRRDEDNRLPPVVHPVVRLHPETGKRAIYVCGNFTTRILELGERESAQVLDFLFAHTNSPEFQCRYHWEPDSIAFWDNRCTQHLGVPDYLERRLMHRTMISGDRPFGPEG